MKKLLKRTYGSYTGVMHEIGRRTFSKETFFYSAGCGHRFAVPKSTIFKHGDDIANTFFRMLGESMVKVIDFDRSLVGYRDSEQHFRVSECYLTKNLISAVKQAKKKKSPYVIDLKTGGLIETNG